MKECTPKSKIGDSNMSYHEYYAAKYDMHCLDMGQSLVRVSGADKRTHHLTPVALKGDNRTTKRARTDRDQVFIPEFCTGHVISASLWREIQLFPFVYERVGALVKAANFLEVVSREMQQQDGPVLRETARDLDMDALLKSEIMGAPPSPEQLLVPFTAKGAGEKENLERMEFLGDVFLKFAAGKKVDLIFVTNSLNEKICTGNSNTLSFKTLFFRYLLYPRIITIYSMMMKAT